MIEGKGLYLWNLTKSVEYYRTEAAVLGLSHVRVKVFDSVGAPHAHGDTGKIEELFSALREVNVEPTAWGYYTGVNPASEVSLTLQLIRRLKPSEYVVNAERYFKAAGMATKALQIMRPLNALDIPVGVTSYRYPQYHAPFPFSTFMLNSDFYEPQVYWNQPAWYTSNQPEKELDETVKQCKAVYPGVVLRPIGRAYAGDGYNPPGPTEKEITQFLTACKDKYSMQSASFWSFDKIALGTNNAPAWKHGISTFSWRQDVPIPIPPPEIELTLEEKVAKLWEAHPELR